MTAAVDQDQEDLAAFAAGDEGGAAAVLTDSAPEPITPPDLESVGQTSDSVGHTTVINNNTTVVASDTGGWVLKIEPKHTCILPDIDARTFVGSIWKCGECQQHWQVYEKRGKNAGTKGFRRATEEVVAKKLASQAVDDAADAAAATDED